MKGPEMANATESAGFGAVESSTSPQPDAASPAPIAPRGISLPIPCLPFVTDRRGRKPARCWFDAPAEGYEAGFLTGYRAFGQYMAALQGGVNFYQRGPVAEVFAVLAQSAKPGPDRKGAALGFALALERWLRFTSTCPDHQVMVANMLQSAIDFNARQVEAAAARKSAFVSRMQAARQAKTANRRAMQGGAHV